MPKSRRTFIENCRRWIPVEVVRVEREVDPARYVQQDLQGTRYRFESGYAKRTA